MKCFFTCFVMALALAGCRHDMNYSSVVAIDFAVPAASDIRLPEAKGSQRLIQEFDSMRQLLQSAELKDELRRVARLDSPYFSLSLEIVTPSAPFTMTVKATSKDDLDRVIACLPGVVKNLAAREGSDFHTVVVQRLGENNAAATP